MRLSAAKHGALKRVQPLVPRAAGGRTWILAYHLVEGGTGLLIDTRREDFISHLDMLRRETDVVSLRDFVGELRRGRGPANIGSERRRPRVVLTFDDAFRNFYDTVMPLLVERSLPATLYVPPGFINGDGNHPLYAGRFAGIEPMTWDQLREALSAGVEIGSHTYRHTNLARLSTPSIVEEMVTAREEIERRLGVRPRSVCYPEGFFSKEVLRVAAGFYETGMTGGGLAIDPGRQRDLLRLPRLPILAGTTADELFGQLEQDICLDEWISARIRRLRGLAIRRA